MSSLLDLLSKYVFAGVPSSAVYDLLKAGWETANRRNWEELYLDAFEAAMNDSRSRLAKYGDGAVTLDREDLRQALHRDLGISISIMSLGELADDQIANKIGEIMARQQVLVIGGHNLSEEDYAQLVRNLARQAIELFKKMVAQKQDAFQQGMVNQAYHDHRLLQETQMYLRQRFDITLEILKDIKEDTAAIRTVIENNQSPGKGTNKQTRLEKLDELMRLSRARCIARWQAVGLDREEAIAFADDTDVGSLTSEYSPSQDTPVRVLIAELGAGKSLIAERLFQAAIDLAKHDISAPIPIFLDARECVSGLRSTVEREAEGLGDIRTQGAAIIVDGVDEAEGSAEKLLTEARILVNLWPKTTVILTSRPLPAFSSDRCQERTEVAPLTVDEAMGLIKRVSNRDRLFLHSWPKSIQEAIKRPLFALLLGVYYKLPREDAPQSIGELLAYLVERSVGHTTIEHEKAESLLQKLAVYSIDHAGAFTPASEIGSRSEIQSLLATRLVVERNGKLGYPLAILSEWFAAQSLANGYPSVDELSCNTQRLWKWKYPLITFISTHGFEQISRVLTVLAASHPAFVSEIISEATPKWGRRENRNVFQDSFELGERIRITMVAWSQGVGPLAPIIAPIYSDGCLRPLGVKYIRHHNWASVSWYHGNESLSDIVNDFPKPISLEWPMIMSFHPGDYPAWVWKWSRDFLRNELKKIIEQKQLLPEGPLLQEFFWRVSLAVAGYGDHWMCPIPIDEVTKRLERIGPYETVQFSGKITLSSAQVALFRKHIITLKEQHSSLIFPPWPGPDKTSNGPVRMIWSDFSDEQMLKRTRVVLAAAIEGYKQLASTWFHPFASELTTAALMPAKLIGKLIPPPASESEHWKGPSLQWYWLPLPKNEPESVEIELASQLSEDDLESRFQEIYHAIQNLRPEAASWLSATYHDQVFYDLFSADPVTTIVYSWLKDDLQRVSWIE